MSKYSKVQENGGAKPMRALKRSERSRLGEFLPSFGVLGCFLVGVCLVSTLSFFGYRSVANCYGFSDRTEIFVLLNNNNNNSNSNDNKKNNNMYNNNNNNKKNKKTNNSSNSNSSKRVGFLEESGNGCDVFNGDWVWDESYPLYQSKDCRFLDEGFKCSDYGRSDLLYTHWRWQPRHCNLPKFDAKLMLEKLRDKRLVFVGDSVGRNHWESLLCLLSSAVKNERMIYEVNGSPITKHTGFLVFKFEEYNCTVEYYRSPFLVPQVRPPIGYSPKKVKTTLKLDTMDWSSTKWRDADVLVLNTGHWWNDGKTIKTRCYFQQGEEVNLEMNVDDAYKRALSTVVKWIQTEVDSNKTQVFFRTFAPLHFRGGNRRTRGTCHMETLPEFNGTSSVPSETWEKLKVLGDVLSHHSNRSEAVKMEVLNITAMSAQRKDGHPSLYYLGVPRPAPFHLQDCSHWCLPGVPDTWNELLYALFMKRQVLSSSSS